jgi:glutamate-1-semialdehyde 2,1-aminomutase
MARNDIEEVYRSRTPRSASLTERAKRSLPGQGEIAGRALLAEFNDIASFERVLAERGREIAAVVIEPVMYTGVVMPPLPGFLNQLQAAARQAGALFVLDDCLMFRLAPGGSAELYGLEPDIIFLGKFIGGGLPCGAVGGRAEIMDLADPARPGGLYHGGSFNGNVLASLAGRVAVEELTAGRIATMNRLADRLKGALEARGRKLGLPVILLAEGSVMGLYFAREKPRPGPDMPNQDLSLRFHLACLNNGVQMGPGNMISLATPIDDKVLDEAIEGMGAALEAIAP